MNRKWIFIILVAFLTLSSCGGKDAKDNFEIAGKQLGEITRSFKKGLRAGYSEIKVTTDKSITAFGLNVNYAEKKAGSPEITVYIIFNQDYQGIIRLKLYNASGSEIGRSALTVNGKTNDAKYFIFRFDNNTPFDKAEEYRVE